jgi:hypothetical protein
MMLIPTYKLQSFEFSSLFNAAESFLRRPSLAPIQRRAKTRPRTWAPRGPCSDSGCDYTIGTFMSISVAKKQDGVVNDSQTSLNMKLHEVTIAGSEWFLGRDVIFFQHVWESRDGRTQGIGPSQFLPGCQVVSVWIVVSLSSNRPLNCPANVSIHQIDQCQRCFLEVSPAVPLVSLSFTNLKSNYFFSLLWVSQSVSTCVSFIWWFVLSWKIWAKAACTQRWWRG